MNSKNNPYKLRQPKNITIKKDLSIINIIKMSPDKNRSNLRFPPQTFKIPSDQLLCKYLHRPPSQTRKRQRKEKVRT